jgi:hypothetical protein
MLAAMTASDPTPPREPEIELLGRIAARAIWVLRRALWLGGVAAVGYGLWRICTQVEHAAGFVWICVGLPLLLPVGWTFGRGRACMLTVAAALIWGPSLLPDDQDHAWILRFFAALIPCLTLLVWRTVWRLTRAGNPGDSKP